MVDERHRAYEHALGVIVRLIPKLRRKDARRINQAEISGDLSFQCALKFKRNAKVAW